VDAIEISAKIDAVIAAKTADLAKVQRGKAPLLRGTIISNSGRDTFNASFDRITDSNMKKFETTNYLFFSLVYGIVAEIECDNFFNESKVKCFGHHPFLSHFRRW
jgi:hypothetical protein